MTATSRQASGVGHQLHTHHNSLTAAKAIIALGDLSSLYELLGTGLLA
jgi:hypothetical protein